MSSSGIDIISKHHYSFFKDLFIKINNKMVSGSNNTRYINWENICYILVSSHNFLCLFLLLGQRSNKDWLEIVFSSWLFLYYFPKANYFSFLAIPKFLNDIPCNLPFPLSFLWRAGGLFFMKRAMATPC